MNNMIAHPWLSIVIPIYNADQYLNDCLKSIATQTFKNYEVILVDDGSTDKSSDICRKTSRADSRFKYYRIENSGALQARLYGMDRAQGRYITFCDADDYYANGKAFENLYNKVSSIKYSVSFIQFGNYAKYNHLFKRHACVKQDLYLDPNQFYSNDYPLLLCSRWEKSHLSFSVWNKLYDRRLIENSRALKVTGKVFWGEDLILNLFMLQKVEGAYYIPDVLYVYRVFSGGTGKLSLTTMKDLNLIKTYQLEFLARLNYPETARMRKILFAEIAAWSALNVKQVADYLNETQLEVYIKNMLELPTFIQAQRYYSDYPEAWDEAELIRKSQVQDYVAYARRREKIGYIVRVKRYLKHIIKSI